MNMEAIGNTIIFGLYDWRVLDARDDKALILSVKTIENRAYSEELAEVTWENCDIRQYLNWEFYNHFTAEEKAFIAETQIKNAGNPWHGTSGGSDTTDRIFLLSIDEAVRYFGDSGLLGSGNLKNEFWLNDKYNTSRIAYGASGRASWWWLRSPGIDQGRAAGVGRDGGIFIGGLGVDDSGGSVRPALWLKHV